jgi:hypothetical protein
MLLKVAFTAVRDWLGDCGLMIDLLKKEPIHHAKSRKMGTMNLPEITLPTNNPNVTQTMKQTPTIKSLGVWFNWWLTFRTQVKKAASKVEKAADALSILSNSIWGLDQSHLCNLYWGAILPMMTYASTAWWNGSNSLVCPLSIMQNKAICHITGAFHTTLIYAMEIEASIPPVPLLLNYYNDHAATHFMRLDSCNPIITCMPAGTLPAGLVPSSTPPLPP